MNQPGGYSLTNGHVTSAQPLKVIFNGAVPYEVPHMILAAYLVTGFIVASVYAVGMLRGRRDHIHRLGLLIPLTVACIATSRCHAVALATEVSEHAGVNAPQRASDRGPKQNRGYGNLSMPSVALTTNRTPGTNRPAVKRSGALSPRRASAVRTLSFCSAR